MTEIARLKVRIEACIERRDEDGRAKLQTAVDEAIKAGVDPRSDDIRWAKIVLQPDFDPARASAIRNFYHLGLGASGGGQTS